MVGLMAEMRAVSMVAAMTVARAVQSADTMVDY